MTSEVVRSRGNAPRLHARRSGMKRRSRAVRVGHRVVKRVRTKGSKRNVKRPVSDVTGTFVKCKDWKNKKKRISKKAKAFARRVNGIIYSHIPRQTELYSYAFELYPTALADNRHVRWFQLCLDPLAGGSNPWYNSALRPGLQGAGNPAGISQGTGTLLKQADTTGSTSKDAFGPSVWSSTYDQTQAGGILIPAGKELMYRQGHSSMKVQFKNTQQFGLTIEIFWVKPRRLIQGQHLASWNAQLGTDAVTLTSSAPTGWFNYDGAYTPLELAQLGLHRASGGITGTQLWQNPMLGLHDSSDFNTYYKVVKTCKAYLPPGGMVEKNVYHKRCRFLTQQYVTQNLYDRRTTFMVVRYVPEVMELGTASNATVALGGGVPCGVGAGSSPWIADLVGVVYYRHTYKQVYGNSPTAYLGQFNKQVISSNLIAGQATEINKTV